MLVSCVILAACGTIHAENRTSFTVTGRVIDAVTEENVAEANITIVGTDIRTAADEAGEFTVSLPPGDHTLLVTHVAYKPTRQRISAVDDDEMQITILLEPTAIPVSGVTVTASRSEEDVFSTPTPVSVTTQEEFDGKNFASTADLLKEEPGVLVQKTTHGHGTPILRGQIGKDVLLLFNGIRLNNSTFRSGGNQYMNTIDQEALEKIEIVRGPSSVLYGSDALGGAVNMITERLPLSESGMNRWADFSLHYSSADLGRSANLSSFLASEEIAVKLAGTYKRIGDLRAGEPIGRQDPTGWTEFSLSGRTEYSPNEQHHFNISMMTVRQDDVPRYDKYESGDFEAYIYDPQNRDLISAGYEMTPESGPVERVKINLSYQGELEGKTTRKTGSETTSLTESDLSKRGGLLQIDISPAATHSVTAGFETYFERLATEAYDIVDDERTVERPEYPNGSRYSSGGVFVQDRFILLPQVSVTTGGRYSYFRAKSDLEQPFGFFEQDYSDFTGALSLSYKPDENVNLIAGLSRGFRAPNLNDLVVLKYSSSGVDAPSTGLDPEETVNIEIGAKLKGRRFRGELFIYHTRLRNLIDRRPGTYSGLTFFDENDNGIKDTGEFDIYQNRNVGEGRIVGFETAGSGWITGSAQIRGNLFWTWGENETADEPLSRIPPLMGMAAIRYYTDDNRWIECFVRAAGSQRRLSQRDIDDTRIPEGGTPSWATVNLRFETRLHPFTLNITAENLLDASYREHGSGINAPGRNIIVSLRGTVR